MKRVVAPRAAVLLTVMLVAALPGWGCSDDASRPEEKLPDPYPPSLAQPADLLDQLETCYERREIERYAELLDPEFRFLFNENDVTPEIPDGVWNAVQDSAGTRNLFGFPEVVDIRVDLTAFSPQPGTTSTGIPAQRIRVAALLDVDIDGGETTLRVNNESQDFYFRMGSAEKGTDPGRWYLIEWEDLGGTAFAGKLRQEVESKTWGGIKTIFAGGE